MRVLFIHQNIPGQFGHLIAALCADAANSVWAIGTQEAATRAIALFPRLNVVSYGVPAGQAGGHPWLADVDAQLRRGQEVARTMRQVKDKGVAFDVIVAHPGWGEALFVKDVFPATPLLTCFELTSATGRRLPTRTAGARRSPRSSRRPARRWTPAACISSASCRMPSM